MSSRPPESVDRPAITAPPPTFRPATAESPRLARPRRRSSRTSTDWRRVLRRACVSGSVAAVASAVAVALLARRRTGSLASGANATSHVLWGDEPAARCHQADLRHTALGYAIHHSSAVFWALGFEWLLASRRPPHPLAAAAASAATAYAVDYHLVPKRLTPGFELHLSRREMAGVYAVIAAGLALTAMLRNEAADR